MIPADIMCYKSMSPIVRSTLLHTSFLDLPGRQGVTSLRVLAFGGHNSRYLTLQAQSRTCCISGRFRIFAGLAVDNTAVVHLQGIAIVRLLKQIELRTQRRIHELFDLVCGTSTGGILAVALALQQMTLEQCEGIYRHGTSTSSQGSQLNHGLCNAAGGLRYPCHSQAC